jgi:hypothetical protein
MKKFETMKVTFEAYISVNTFEDMEAIREALYVKLADKMEMYCTDKAFGLTDCKITLETEQ